MALSKHILLTKEELKTIRSQFPILDHLVNNEPLIYFDNAATTQKPQQVIDRLVHYYSFENANIHRGVHTLAERATRGYEESRKTIASFIHAEEPNEVIFTSGTTEGLNFLAVGLVEPILAKGDIILTTKLEHHSNLVPWQELSHRTGAELVFMPLTADYQVDVGVLNQLDVDKIKVITIQHVSNILGVEQPIKELTKWAHQHDILVIVDGAQAVPHMSVNVQELGVDAYCFSGHKLYGPTGVGVCYLNKKWHKMAQPVKFGGEMIHSVGDYKSDYKESPWKFEGGTPPIAQAIGLSEAVKFVDSIGIERIKSHEDILTKAMLEGLHDIDGIHIYPDKPGFVTRHGIISFNIEGVHPHDAATGYDMEGIAVRAGHHCAQPLMRKLEVQATLRASLSIYNTLEEVEQFIQSTKRVKEFFTGGTI